MDTPDDDDGNGVVATPAENTGGAGNQVGVETIRTETTNYELILSTGQQVAVGRLESDIGAYEIESTLAF